MTSTNQPVRLDDLITHVVSRHPEADSLQHLTRRGRGVDQPGRESLTIWSGISSDQARRSGASWTDIGQYMGVDQAGPRRSGFVGASDARDPDITAPPIRPLQSLHQAGSEARWRRPGCRPLTSCQDEVTNELIVLGLIDERDSLAAIAIAELGAPLEQVRGGRPRDS